MFVITGTVQGRKASLRWEDGILSGDQVALDKARHENTLDHGELGPVPAQLYSDYLRGELPAHNLLKSYVFDTIISEEDDWEPYNPNAIY